MEMDRTGIMELEGMEFMAYHGCLEHERRDGNIFMVDFKGELYMNEAAETDRLEDTLNYGEIYRLVAAEMAIPSDLLEHVAGRIVKAIEKAFPELLSFSIRVSKKMPPVEGKVQWSRVTLFHNR